jgi:Asp-tRNA(Asn)/Glu-tRNA(Gln) amidotransferase A subunit family amidase
MEELLRLGHNLSSVDKILKPMLEDPTWPASSHLLLQLLQVPGKDKANLRVQLLKEFEEKEIPQDCHPEIDQALRDLNQRKAIIMEASCKYLEVVSPSPQEEVKRQVGERHQNRED